MFYPHAKVSLSVRDPEKWFSSIIVLHKIFRTLIQQLYFAPYMPSSR